MAADPDERASAGATAGRAGATAGRAGATAGGPPPAEDLTVTLSRRLRVLRAERNLSLRAVARIAQVSPSLLSQIERGEASPSLLSLVAIADALGVRPGRLLEDPEPIGERSPVLRRSQRRVIDDRLCRREYLMHLDDPYLEVAELHLPPGGCSRPAVAAHSGRDYGIVVEGTATVELSARLERLEEGDYIAFDAGIPHRLINESDSATRVIWIIAHGGERMDAGGGPSERGGGPRAAGGAAPRSERGGEPRSEGGDPPGEGLGGPGGDPPGERLGGPGGDPPGERLGGPGGDPPGERVGGPGGDPPGEGLGAGSRRSPAEALGIRLRELRTRRGQTLRAVAERADVSPSLLSQIERGEASPSLLSLGAIAEALAVRPGELLEGDEHDPASPVVRHAERRVIEDPQCRREYMMDLNDPYLHVAELRIVPHGASRPTPAAHSGRDYGVVLEGQVTLELDAARERMDEGDYVAFNARARHRLLNETDRPVRMLWVMAPVAPGEDGP
jgi:transcriptional regulator with XRE-family HTH domain